MKSFGAILKLEVFLAVRGVMYQMNTFLMEFVWIAFVKLKKKKRVVFVPL